MIIDALCSPRVLLDCICRSQRLYPTVEPLESNIENKLAKEKPYVLLYVRVPLHYQMSLQVSLHDPVSKSLASTSASSSHSSRVEARNMDSYLYFLYEIGSIRLAVRCL